MKRLILAVMTVGAAISSLWAADYPIKAASMTKTRVTGGFWFDRLATNRLVTLKTCFAKCNETPRIANFTNAAARAWGRHGGAVWDDSDVYKVMEGAAYVLATHPDAELEAYVDWLIGQIAKAQEPDGYLYTARLIGDDWINKTARWEELDSTHELYCMGHMIEASVAWHEATGKTNFLNVAVKAADMMCRTFGYGPTELRYAPGHQEIELALCKLFRTTGERRYLDLAKFFLDIRGRADIRHPSPKFGPTWGAGIQDHLPVLRQTEAVGHAVRAGYMYAGMADVAALKGECAYVAAVERLWEDVVGRKLALTGGIGGRAHFEDPVLGKMGETFAPAYDLPNEAGVTYNETCAAIGNALWNERLFLSSGDAKYVDVLERTLYNGFLSGVSLSGDEFFYPNPLASTNGYRRSKWFGCSCCPVNVVRFIPQIPSMIYATGPNRTLYWNLFASSKAAVRLQPVNYVELEQTSDYPWSGKATLRIAKIVSKPVPRFALKIRVPGWAKGQTVPSDLYAQTVPSSVMEVSVAVNSKAVNAVPGKDGYLTVERVWKVGDMVEVNLPMPVKRIRAHEKVEADRGRLAVERGPIVYCAEGCDNGGKAYDAVLSADATFTEEPLPIGDRRFVMLRASNGLKLVPYCIWGNREPGNEMQVWFKEK